MALILNANELGLLHPAYLVTDYTFSIRAFGPSIRRAFPELAPGDGLLDHFTIERPIGKFDLARMLRDREQIWLLGRSGLRLRGVIIDQSDELYFLVNYAPASLRSGSGYQLQMWDFSPADATLDALIAVEVQKALIAETQEVLKELADARDAAEASSAATRDYYAGLVRALWSPDEGRERIDRFVEVLSAAGPTAVVEDVVRDSTDLLYAILDDGEPAFVRSTVGSAAAMDPLQVVAEICAGSMAAFERVGVELQLDLDAPTGQLCFGSAEALRRVIERMLGYARDRSGSGWVKLHAVCIPDGPNHRLRVACMDTGGLPGQDDDAGGDAARAAGGRFTLLTLESVGVKSEFQITYPALPTGIRGEADRSRASGDVGTVAPGPDVRAAANVLVVSSDVVDRRLVEAVLAPPHVNLVVVPDGDAAVALWRERNFDLALVDLRGAGHDGLSTAQHLRDAEARLLRPRVPIVIMSHQVILDHLDADATQHVDAFMAKPISPAELLSVLSRMAGRRI